VCGSKGAKLFFLVLACGVAIGAVVGFLAAGFFTQQKLRRIERESWIKAESFFNKVRQEEGR
jgi:xanthine/uracil permease